MPLQPWMKLISVDDHLGVDPQVQAEVRLRQRRLSALKIALSHL